MKRLLTVFALLVVLTAAVIGAGAPTHPAEPARQEAAFVPNQVDLYLPSNPTTGYAWVCEVEDASLIAVRDQFFEDSGELGFVGVGGTHWFHLSGLRPGTTSVTFRYLRSWEPDTPAAQTTYRISVDERLNVLIWGVEVA